MKGYFFRFDINMGGVSVNYFLCGTGLIHIHSLFISIILWNILFLPLFLCQNQGSSDPFFLGGGQGQNSSAQNDNRERTKKLVTLSDTFCQCLLKMGLFWNDFGKKQQSVPEGETKMFCPFTGVTLDPVNYTKK